MNRTLPLYIVITVLTLYPIASHAMIYANELFPPNIRPVVAVELPPPNVKPIAAVELRAFAAIEAPYKDSVSQVKTVVPAVAVEKPQATAATAVAVAEAPAPTPIFEPGVSVFSIRVSDYDPSVY